MSWPGAPIAWRPDVHDGTKEQRRSTCRCATETCCWVLSRSQTLSASGDEPAASMGIYGDGAGLDRNRLATFALPHRVCVLAVQRCSGPAMATKADGVRSPTQNQRLISSSTTNAGPAACCRSEAQGKVGTQCIQAHVGSKQLDSSLLSVLRQRAPAAASAVQPADYSTDLRRLTLLCSILH